VLKIRKMKRGESGQKEDREASHRAGSLPANISSQRRMTYRKRGRDGKMGQARAEKSGMKRTKFKKEMVQSAPKIYQKNLGRKAWSKKHVLNRRKKRTLTCHLGGRGVLGGSFSKKGIEGERGDVLSLSG